MEREEKYLIENYHIQFFDKNYLIANDKRVQLEEIFQINLNDQDVDLQKLGKVKLISKFLQYDIGLNILQMTLFRRNQVQINGVYHFLGVKDLETDLEQLFKRLYKELTSDKQFNDDDILVHHKIAQNLITLLKSIIMRKEKELKLNQQNKFLLTVQVEEEIKRSKETHKVFQNKFFILQHIKGLKQRGKQIVKNLCEMQDDSLITKILIQEQQFQIITALSYDYKISNFIVLLESYSMFELQLFVSKYIKLQLPQNVIRQIKIIYNLEDKDNSDSIFADLEYIFAEQPSLRKRILEFLYNNKFKFIEEALYMSQIDWSDMENSKILIKILIKINKIQNAYCYANQTQDDDIFKYLCMKLNKIDRLVELFNYNLSCQEDEIVGEYMINNVLNHDNFIFYLLKKSNFDTAINFCNNYNQELSLVVEEWMRQHISVDSNKQVGQFYDFYDNDSSIENPNYSFLIPVQYQIGKKGSKKVSRY